MDINDINTLYNIKKYGSFIEMKKNLKNIFGFDVKARSWKALFEKLQNIKKIINNADKSLFITNSFLISKNKISEKLGIYSCADNLQQLKNDFDKLIIFFTLKKFDPYEEFEKSKIADFTDSSRLEGIYIKKTNKTLDEIIKQYKVEKHG